VILVVDSWLQYAGAESERVVVGSAQWPAAHQVWNDWTKSDFIRRRHRRQRPFRT